MGSCAAAIGRRRTVAAQRPRARRARLRPARRALWTLLVAPLAVRLAVAVIAVLTAWAAANWIYQVIRKPTELFFPVSGALAKSPAETWRQYAPLFRDYSTARITPELLAALAQVEGAGDPVARTYWRWSATWHPFEIYRPASTAVGMFQMTDETSREARRYCIRDHVAVEAGPTAAGACGWRGLYVRVVPSHAVEMTAALLDRRVSTIVRRSRIGRATARQEQDLAAVVHLCGAGPGAAFARRGFRLVGEPRCGDHDLRRYLGRLDVLRRQFARLAARG